MAQTVLLAHFDSDYTDVTGNSTLTASGSAINTTTKKFGAGAAGFDGNDYVTVDDNPLHDFGSGDFTYEAWVYPESRAQNCTIFARGTSDDVGTSVWIFLNVTTGYLSAYASTTGSSWNIGGDSTVAAPLNDFSHIRVVRDGDMLRAWQNGVNTINASFTGALPASSGPIVIGGYVTRTAHNFIGVIDEVRVSDYAVSTGTASFTPPDTPFNLVAAGTPSGFSSTTLGTPTRDDRMIPAGFNSTVFGGPFASFDIYAIPGPIAGTSIGTPVADNVFVPRDVTAWPYGAIPAAVFGTPRRFVPNTAAGFNRTRFGNPRAVLNKRSGVASGFNTTAFGSPIATSRFTAFAPGISGGSFGTPRAQQSVIGQVAGFSSSRFGRPAFPQDLPKGDRVTVFSKINQIFVTHRGAL